MKLSRLTAVLREGPPARRTLVCAGSRVRGLHGAWQLATAGGLELVDLHSGPDPFAPLTFEQLREVLGRSEPAVIDGSGARPWDDPVWRTAAQWLGPPGTGTPHVILLPPRLAPALGEVDLHIEAGEPSPLPERLRSLVDRALLSGATPGHDDDGPLLRAAILRERQHGGDQRQLAVLLLRLGQYELNHGTALQALRALTEAAAIARERALAQADEGGVQHDLAGILDVLADTAVVLDRLEEADHARAASAAASLRQLALEPDSEKARWGTAVSGSRLAYAERGESGRHSHSISKMQDALRVARARGDARATEDQVQLGARLVELLLGAGRLGEAEAALKGAIDLAQSVVRERPRRFDLVSDLVPLLCMQSGLEIALGRGRDQGLSAARAALDEATQLAQQLVLREASRADWLGAIAALAIATADTLVSDGDVRGALAALEQSDRLYTRLIERDPARASHRAEQARAWRRRGYAYLALGQVERASADFAAQLVVASRHRRRAPERPGRIHDLALAVVALAIEAEARDLRRLAGRRWAAAISLVQEALSQSEETPLLIRTRRRCEDGVERTACARSQTAAWAR